MSLCMLLVWSYHSNNLPTNVFRWVREGDTHIYVQLFGGRWGDDWGSWWHVRLTIYGKGNLGFSSGFCLGVCHQNCKVWLVILGADWNRGSTIVVGSANTLACLYKMRWFSWIKYHILTWMTSMWYPKTLDCGWPLIVTIGKSNM